MDCKFHVGALLVASALVLTACAPEGQNSAAIQSPQVETQPRPEPEPEPEPEPAPEPGPTSEPEPKPEADEPAQTFSASGEQNTAPFELRGGNYRVLLQISGECYYSFRLVSLADDSGERLISADEPGDYDSYVYGVEAGTFYLSVNTGPSPSCPWVLEFNPL